jgi:hypothetical protein
MSQIKRKHASRKQIAKIIEKQISFFNGWRVEEETVRTACDIAAVLILWYLRGKTLVQPK